MYKYITEGEFEMNPYAATSGGVSGAANVIGNELGRALAGAGGPTGGPGTTPPPVVGPEGANDQENGDDTAAATSDGAGGTGGFQDTGDAGLLPPPGGHQGGPTDPDGPDGPPPGYDQDPRTPLPEDRIDTTVDVYPDGPPPAYPGTPESGPDGPVAAPLDGPEPDGAGTPETTGNSPVPVAVTPVPPVQNAPAQSTPDPNGRTAEGQPRGNQQPGNGNQQPGNGNQTPATTPRPGAEAAATATSNEGRNDTSPSGDQAIDQQETTAPPVGEPGSAEPSSSRLDTSATAASTSGAPAFTSAADASTNPSPTPSTEPFTTPPQTGADPSSASAADVSGRPENTTGRADPSPGREIGADQVVTPDRSTSERPGQTPDTTTAADPTRSPEDHPAGATPPPATTAPPATTTSPAATSSDGTGTKQGTTPAGGRTTPRPVRTRDDTSLVAQKSNTESVEDNNALPSTDAETQAPAAEPSSKRAEGTPATASAGQHVTTPAVTPPAATSSTADRTHTPPTDAAVKVPRFPAANTESISVDELIADLNAAVLDRPDVPADNRLLGTDLFGLLTVPPPPDFMAGHDYSTLTTGQSVSFFNALNITGDTPATADLLDPNRLEDAEDWVIPGNQSGDALSAWAPGDVPPLPEVVEMPMTVHAIWLGGPLRDAGPMANFRENYGAAGQAYEGAAQLVLWTDVPRDQFDEARSTPPPPNGGPDPLADVRDMLEWAKNNNIVLVNVHEVFNSASPMGLHEFFLMEMNKQVGPGYAAASDILRLEILRRFGGVYSDGDNRIQNLDEIEDIVASPEAFAVHRHSGGNPGNSAFVMPKNHPFAQMYLDEVRNRYTKNQRDLYPEGIDVISPTYFDRGKGYVHRNSVMLRTGPTILEALPVRLGYAAGIADYPGVMNIEMNSDGSWVRPPTAASSHTPEPSRADTVELTKKVVQTLVRQLLNREGDLHLTFVEGAVNKHPRPDVVWNAALTFIAENPDLASQVRTVTDTKRVLGGDITTVVLPERARRLLTVDDSEPQHWLGEYKKTATLTPPKDGSPRRTEGERVLEDESWRHSRKGFDHPDAAWAKHPTPVDPAQVAAVRDRVPPTRFLSETGGLTADSVTTIGPDGRPQLDLKVWRSPIGYDTRRIEFPDGTVVQDRTFRLHLHNPGGHDLTAFKQAAADGVADYWNKGYALPRGDQLNLHVEFTDDPADATGVVTVAPPGTAPTQTTLPLDAKPVHFAHEIGGHFGGLGDRYRERDGDSPSIFQHESKRKVVEHDDGTTEVVGTGRVIDDNGIMGARADQPGAEVKPRDLWSLDKTGPNPHVITPSHVDRLDDQPVNPNTTARGDSRVTAEPTGADVKEPRFPGRDPDEAGPSRSAGTGDSLVVPKTRKGPRGHRHSRSVDERGGSPFPRGGRRGAVDGVGGPTRPSTSDGNPAQDAIDAVAESDRWLPSTRGERLRSSSARSHGSSTHSRSSSQISGLPALRSAIEHRRVVSGRERQELADAKRDGQIHDRREVDVEAPHPERTTNAPRTEPVKVRTHLEVAGSFTAAMHDYGLFPYLSGGAALGLQGGTRPINDLDFRVTPADPRFTEFGTGKGIEVVDYLNRAVVPRAKQEYQVARKSKTNPLPGGGQVDQFVTVSPQTIGTGNWLGHEVSMAVVNTSPSAVVKLGEDGSGPRVDVLSLEDIRADKAKTALTRTKKDQGSVKKIAQDLFDLLDATDLIDRRDGIAWSDDPARIAENMRNHVDQALADRRGQYEAANLDGRNLHHLSDQALVNLMLGRLVLTAKAHVDEGPRRDAFDAIVDKLIAPIDRKLGEPAAQQDPDTRTRVEREADDLRRERQRLVEVRHRLDARLRAVASTPVPDEVLLAVRPWIDLWNDPASFGPTPESQRAKRPGVPPRPPLDGSTTPPSEDESIPEALVKDILEIHSEDLVTKVRAAVPKSTEGIEKVVRVLAFSGGFRTLTDSGVDAKTLAAFDLTKSEFSKAFKALKAGDFVVPSSGGLSLTKKGWRQLVPLSGPGRVHGPDGRPIVIPDTPPGARTPEEDPVSPVEGRPTGEPGAEAAPTASDAGPSTTTPEVERALRDRVLDLDLDFRVRDRFRSGPIEVIVESGETPSGPGTPEPEKDQADAAPVLAEPVAEGAEPVAEGTAADSPVTTAPEGPGTEAGRNSPPPVSPPDRVDTPVDDPQAILHLPETSRELLETLPGGVAQGLAQRATRLLHDAGWSVPLPRTAYRSAIDLLSRWIYDGGHSTAAEAAGVLVEHRNPGADGGRDADAPSSPDPANTTPAPDEVGTTGSPAPVTDPAGDRLTPAQRNALKIAAERGARSHEADRAAAADRLRRLNATAGTRYPVDDQAALDDILDAAHLHLRTMDLVRNIDLTRAPAGVPRVPGQHTPVAAEYLTSHGRFPTFWETGYTFGTPLRSGRGWVEEKQGYGSVLNRTSGDPADRDDTTSDFAPTAPHELPAYGALNSGLQHGGVYSYGTTVMHLKQEVRPRTTFTPMDSAATGSGGMESYTDGEHLFGLLAHGHEENVRLALGDITGFRYDDELRAQITEDGFAAVGRYFEAQVHGGIGWSNIAKVVVNWGDLYGRAAKNTTLAEAEGMVAYLTDFATANGYDFQVQLGREIGRPGGMEAAEKERVFGLFEIDEIGPAEREVLDALDQLAKPTPFPARAEREDLLNLAAHAGIDTTDPDDALLELWSRAERVVPDGGGIAALREELGLSRPDRQPPADDARDTTPAPPSPDGRSLALQERVRAARNTLGKMSPHQYDQLMGEAVRIASGYHRAPLFIETMSPEEARLRAVIDDVYVIVAHALHTGNDQVARNVARDLARELGTQRTTLAGGASPDPGPRVVGRSSRSTAAAPVAGSDVPPAIGAVEVVSDTFVEDLFDELDAKVAPAIRPESLREDWDSPRPADTDSLTPRRMRQEYGMPEVNQRRFQSMADRFNITYDVRPTNPHSVRWLERGAVPKPVEIKAKTINELDTYLGASPDAVGLVGYFAPARPDLSTVPPELHAQVQERYRNREHEYAELRADIDRLEAAGTFRVDRDNGTVEMNTSTGYKPITGDHDVFDMRLHDGRRLSGTDYELASWLLVRRSSGVQHGAHMYWQPQGSFQQRIFDDIVGRHRQDARDSEPLIRFSPGRRPSLVFADPGWDGPPGRTRGTDSAQPAPVFTTPRWDGPPTRIPETDAAEPPPPDGHPSSARSPEVASARSALAHRAAEARAKLGKLPEGRYEGLSDLAATIASGYLATPMTLGTPSPEQARLRAVADDVHAVVTHVLHSREVDPELDPDTQDGVQAARDEAARLARELDMRRTTLAGGAAPRGAASAMGRAPRVGTSSEAGPSRSAERAAARPTGEFHGDREGLLSPEDFVVTFDPDVTPDADVAPSDKHVVFFEPRPGAPSGWQPATRDYRISSDGTVPPFTRHAYEAAIRSGDDFPAMLAEVARTTPEKPPVVFSADGTLAVPQADRDGHFKEFYATADVVADANTRLGDVGSKVELRTVPGNVLRRDGKKLLMVQPHFKSAPAGVPSEFSAQVIGDKHQQVVLRPQGDSTLPALGQTRKEMGEYHGTHQLADVLAKVGHGAAPGLLAPQDVAAATSTANPGSAPRPGAEYGTALRTGTAERSRLDAAAERLGVNQHAWAKPGEAYIIQSIAVPAVDEQGRPGANYGLDHARSAAGPVQQDAVWNHHFGGVVVTSADDRAQVTIEAVGQGFGRRKLLDGLIELNLDKYRDDPESFRTEDMSRGQQVLVENLEVIRRQRALLDDENVRGAERQYADLALEHAMLGVREAITLLSGQENLPSLGRMWFLAQYGRAPGETFFDRWGRVDRPDLPTKVVNPLTVVAVSHRGVGESTIEADALKTLDPDGVASGRQALDVVDANRLKGVVKNAVAAAMWRRHNGLRLPEIHVHGSGNSLLHARETGRKRADVVAAWVAAEVARQLAGHPGQPLAPDSIRVVPVSHGREFTFGKPEADAARRQVRVKIVLPEGPGEGPARRPVQPEPRSASPESVLPDSDYDGSDVDDELVFPLDDRPGLDRVAAEIAARTPWSGSDYEGSEDGGSENGGSENGDWADLGGLAAEIAGRTPWSGSDRGEVRPDAPTPDPEPRSAWSAWGSDSESDSEHDPEGGEFDEADPHVDGWSADVVGAERSEVGAPGVDHGVPGLAAEAARAYARLGKRSAKYYDALLERAAFIASGYHRVPLVIGDPTPEQARLRAVVDDVYIIVADELHHHGKEAAASRAHQLAGELGTRRTTLAGGARPEPESPAVGGGSRDAASSSEAGPSGSRTGPDDAWDDGASDVSSLADSSVLADLANLSPVSTVSVPPPTHAVPDSRSGDTPSRAPEFLGSGVGAFTEVVDRVVRGGHGSVAAVTAYERGADHGHEWEVVNDHGVVSLVDVQAGTTRPATPDAVPAGTDRLYAVPLDANGEFIDGEPSIPPSAPAELGADVVARHGEAVSSADPDWSSYLDFLEARIQASRHAIELLGPDRAVVERERLAGLVLHHREVDVHRMRLEVAAGGEVSPRGTPGRLVPGAGGARLVGAVVTAALAADLAAVLRLDVIALVIGSDAEEPRELRFPPRGRPLPTTVNELPTWL
ncbi:toxin glutamine deamidase domain-containing protein [Saccharothrix sp. BKS2]|uniref:toxin glutamine deamidase domain-containing protein n=1 Tax=Saccharothrix sp. BKS2 TaxID=3064400 RepID=UPI0039EC5EF2